MKRTSEVLLLCAFIALGLAAMPASAAAVNCGIIPAWAPNTAYAAGALVSYGGIEYKALQAETSLNGWAPPNTPALWSGVGACGTFAYGVTTIVSTLTFSPVTGGMTPTVTPTPAGTATPVISPTPVSTLLTAINNLGQVIGTTSRDYKTTCYIDPETPLWGPTAVGFLYTQGSETYLGGGCYTPTVPTAINNKGQLVEWSSIADTLSRISYLYDSTTGMSSALSEVFLSNDIALPLGINDSGYIVGVYASNMEDSSGTGLIDTPGSISGINIGTLGGATASPNAINNSELVVGSSYTPSGAVHAFLYSYGTGIMQDLGTLYPADAGSSATAVNDLGQIVGTSGTHGFLYNGKMIDLGSLGGTSVVPKAINRFGQIVGNALLADGTTRHAFLYANGAMVDLNSQIDSALGITLTDAVGINDSGVIAANGATGYLLTPIIPEWLPGIAYGTGAEVTYAGHIYTCIQGHTSQTGWEPPKVPALWKLVS